MFGYLHFTIYSFLKNCNIYSEIYICDKPQINQKSKINNVQDKL